MKIIRNTIIPFGRNYAAINLFGILFVKRNVRVTPRLINHEAIHSAQIKEMLGIPFYLLYAMEWLYRLVGCKGNIFKAYRSISFEREAYDNENDMSYLKKRRKFAAYRS